VFAALLLVHALPARANPQDVEEGEPVTVEDAWTDPPGELSLQYSGTYTRLHDPGSQELLEQGPTIKLGAIKGVQISLNPNYDTGTVSQRNSGFMLGDILVQANDQKNYIPAFALDVFYAPPFGAGQKTAQYTFRAIASKSLGPTEASPRLHINITDYHLTEPDSESRRDRLQFVFGGSLLFTKTDALVADIVNGPAERIGESETFVEIGWSRDLPDDWTLQLGIGRQVAGEGNAVRAFFAIEKQLEIY
jgi:hypothetical protein